MSVHWPTHVPQSISGLFSPSRNTSVCYKTGSVAPRVVFLVTPHIALAGECMHVSLPRRGKLQKTGLTEIGDAGTRWSARL